MSATEWLDFMTPMLLIALALMLIASLPIPAIWREPLELPTKPFALKKTVLIVIFFIGMSWLLAVLAPQVITPVIRVNLVSFSKIIATGALLVVAIVLICRILQRNNMLAMLCVLIKRHFPFVLIIISQLSFVFLLIFLDGWKRAEKYQEDDLDDEDDPYKDPKGYMNYRGEYCDKYKSNWY